MFTAWCVFDGFKCRWITVWNCYWTTTRNVFHILASSVLVQQPSSTAFGLGSSRESGEMFPSVTVSPPCDHYYSTFCYFLYSVGSHFQKEDARFIDYLYTGVYVAVTMPSPAFLLVRGFHKLKTIIYKWMVSTNYLQFGYHFPLLSTPLCKCRNNFSADDNGPSDNSTVSN